MNTLTRPLAVALLCALSLALGFGGSQVVAERNRLKTNDEKAVVNVVQKADAAVVSVIGSKDLPVLEERFEEVEVFGNIRILQPSLREIGTERQNVSSGTGFFVNRNGLLITNAHVVQDSDAEYTIITNEGHVHDVELLNLDKSMDLALLQVKDKERRFPFIRFNSSNLVDLGQTVIAIGNTLSELRNTVSKGIISGIGRDVVSEQGQFFDQVLQTDAAVNTGNSGGPLLNTRGELIGVIFSTIPGADNVSFAVPVSDVKDFVSGVDERILRRNNPRASRIQLKKDQE